MRSLLTSFFILIVSVACVRSQTTEFTYQGSLTTSGSPATGNYDFEFVLYDSPSGGVQVGSTLALSNVAVANGIFTVKLNFGNQFSGANRFLEIRLRPVGQPALTTLSPRQLINSAPYAVKSLNAENATNAVSLGGIAANQYVLTSDSRMSDARPPTAGSASYIQNMTAAQASSNFNISGTGSASVINAVTEYDLRGQRFVWSPSTDNLFIGVNAGRSYTLGGFNNTYVGTTAGYSALSTEGNSFFGSRAGLNLTFGDSNSFFGSAAGYHATTSGDNAFFGWIAGRESTTGSYNSFFGAAAGVTNVTGSHNTAIGSGADLSSDFFSYATAIGADSVATASNSITLGRLEGEDQVRVFGTLVVKTLSSGGATPLCRNSLFIISTCSSSARYKSNISSFASGMDLIRKLRPVSFTWKESGTLDLGLVAEEVNKVEPLLTTTNEKGEVEGVQYDRVSVVLINAVNEQQRRIEKLEKEVAALKGRLRSRNSGAQIGRPKVRR